MTFYRSPGRGYISSVCEYTPLKADTFVKTVQKQIRTRRYIGCAEVSCYPNGVLLLTPIVGVDDFQIVPSGLANQRGKRGSPADDFPGVGLPFMMN